MAKQPKSVSSMGKASSAKGKSRRIQVNSKKSAGFVDFDELLDQGFDLEDLFLPDFFDSRRPARSRSRTYKINSVERYYGVMKAYVFERINTENSYHIVSSAETKAIIDGLYDSILKDVRKSPLNRRYRDIKLINLILEGNARLDTKAGEHEFPFWHGSTISFKKVPNKKEFFEALDARKKRLIEKILDFEDGEMEYQGQDSSRAEEISIESMRLYCEYPKSEKELAILSAKKERGNKEPKARSNGHRNKKSRQKRR